MTMKPMLVDSFLDSHDFAAAIQASCYLPLVCGLGLYTTYKEKKCLDGGVAMPVPFLKENSRKVFLNMMPDNYLFTRGDMPPNTTKINIWEDSDVRFPLDYYIWRADWADSMFVKGYKSA